MKESAGKAEALSHGLTAEEFEAIRGALGRAPNLAELGIFSAMWSEHCSYKSSRPILKKLPTSGPRVLQGPGENAGAVSIGNGLAVVFKMESHNHPSYIEPYQGAATGVGGILRDIFTMGARPIALLDSLRFGDPRHPRTRYLVGGVVSGIADYGNCVGIPTVGGELSFHPCYNGNILVNVMALGLAQADRLFRGRAQGPGNPVIYVGARTGRDGIHGATMASEEFSSETQMKRPTVQVGDPFKEKLLLEACLELMGKGAIVGIQDMGAAGVTSSSTEMAARAGSGIWLDLGKVPRREVGMTPYEVMLSESQERMLIVARRGKEAVVREVFEKWDLDMAVVGHVTDDGRLQVVEEGELVADIPIGALVDEAPRLKRPAREPKKESPPKVSDLPTPEDLGDVLMRLLSSPGLGSKAPVFRQYDHMVRTNTLILPGSDSALLRVKGTRKALALTADGNGRYCQLDPFLGGAIAVAEAARNLSCTGALPLALTDCLNFGNPEKPEVMGQFEAVVEGMAGACRALGLPVVSGNVSFYNETEGRGIWPTPIVGMVGLLEEGELYSTQWFKSPGDSIVLLGPLFDEKGETLRGGEYPALFWGIQGGFAPRLDLSLEGRVQALTREAIASHLIHSAHDCSEGGLALALAEGCISGPAPTGAEVKLPAEGPRTDLLLFGEAQSRVVVSLGPKNLSVLEQLSEEKGVPFYLLGKVTAGPLKVEREGELLMELSPERLLTAWRGALEGIA